MTQNAIFRSDKSYLDKVMRRLIPVMSIVVIFFALLSIRSIDANAQQTLRNEHEQGLARVKGQIEDDLALYISNSQSLARDDSLIRFLNATSLGVSQATLRTSDLIELHSDEYLAIRHLDTAGHIRLEVTNRNGIAESFVPTEGQAPFSPFTNHPAFRQALASNEVIPVVAGFRLQRTGASAPTTTILLDIFTPIIPNSQATPVGVVHLEIDAENLLSAVRLAQTNLVREQANRRVILLDDNDNIDKDRIIADGSDGAVGEAYILALSSDSTNAWIDEFYENLVAFNDSHPEEFIVQSPSIFAQPIYSASNITIETGLNVNWRLYMVDNRVSFFTPSLLAISGIVIVGVIIIIAAAALIRRLLTPLLAPVEQADSLLQQMVENPDRPTQPQRPVASSTGSELVTSVNNIANRLEQLDRALEDQVARRNRDLQVAGRIGREAAAQSDLEALLKRAINLICNELGFYHAQVFLLDEVSENAVLRYSRGEAGQKMIAQGHRLAVGSQSVVGTVTGEKRSVIVNDTIGGAGDPHSVNPLLPDTRAEMGLPLIIGDNVIGALDIQSRTPNVFKIEDVPTYQLLADQIAVAVYNSQLRDQSQARIQQIDRLNRQLTREAWQQVEDKLELTGEYGSKDVSGELSAPISIRGEIIGTLDADLPRGQSFSEGDRMILQAVAERVALAIENARLFAETQVSLSETSTLYQLSRQLNEANTLEDVLQAIIVTVAPDAAGGQVWLFDESATGGKPDWVSLSVDLEIVPRNDRTSFVGQRYQMSRYAFMTQLSPHQVVFMEDIVRLSTIMSGALIQLFAAINARSMVFIPLNMRGVWKGFLSIEFDTPHNFSDGEKRVYNALIGQAGVAIDNRLLLQQTENALSRQEKLYAASRIINTAQRLPDLVYAAVATSGDQRLDFWLGLAEGDLDRSGWPARVRIIAKSTSGSVIEADDIHHLIVAESSPMRRREPEVLADPGEDITNVTPAVAEMRVLGQRFMAIFPLFSENTPIAFFYMVAAEEFTLSGDDYDVYKAITGQMSIQIQNRRLLERTEEALNETRRLYVATRAISGAHNTNAVYDAVAGHLAMPFIQRRMGQSPDEALNLSITILLAHPEPSIEAPMLRYEYQWQSDPNRAVPIAIGTLLPHEQIPLGRLIHANDDGTLVYPDLATEIPSDWPMLYEILSQHDATSAAVAPLWSRQRWFGTMIVRSDQSDLLDETYSRFLQAIADQVAIAIENQSLQRESEFERQRLFTILSTLPTGVLVLDPVTLEPRQHNERVEELLGQAVKYGEPFTAEAYNIHRTGTNLIYPDTDLPIYQAQNEQLQVQGDDLAVLHEIGQTDLLMSAAPIFNSNNEMFAIVAAFQDISTLRSMENTMQENLRETVLLYETQRSLSESDSLEELLDNIVIQLAIQQPTDAYIIINDEKNNTLNLARFLVQPLENANALYPILRDTMVNINDVQRATAMDEDARRVLTNIDARSVMVLPLRSKSRPQPLGWMLVVDAEPEAFTSEQERIMGTVSDMASTAIDNNFLVASTQDALQETASLYTAATTISRSRDLSELFTAIENALAGMGADMYAGFLMQDKGILEMFNQGFEESVDNGLNFDDLLTLPLPHADGMAVADITRATLGDFELAVLKGQNIKAFAAINLRVKDNRGGRLFVSFKEKHRFSESETRFMNAVADSASVVIDNQVLLEQVQSTLQETSVLYQASKALLETSEPEGIIEVIVNYLIEPHVSQVFIALLNTGDWNSPNAVVEVAASWQSASDIDLLGVTLSPDQFPAWTQLSTDTVLAIHDIYDEELGLDMMEQTSIESLDTRSLVVIPLQVPGRAIGAIWLGSQETHAYTDRDMRIFQAFAEQTSLTLEAARLLDQTEARARQLQTSAAISQSVGQILDLDILLPQVVALIKEQFHYDHVQVFLMDAENDWAMLRASTGEAGEKLLGIGHKLRRGSVSVIGRVTELGEPSIALDTADANVVHAPNPYLPLTRSEMALPLLIKGEVVGALDVQSNQPNAFTDEDTQALTTLAAQIAVAIENARLYEEAESAAADMGFLFEITTAAAAAETMEESLQTVAQQMREAIHSQTVAIFLPQAYEDFRGNKKTMLEVEALAIEGKQVENYVSSIEVGDEDNLIGIVGRSLQSQVVDDIEHDRRYHPISRDARSAIAVPISSGVQLVGLIVMESDQTHAYNNDTLTLLLTLGGSLAAIIQNTLLLERLAETVEQLREVDRLKSQFLASMSHELRTPLNSIIGFSRVMLKEIDGPLTEMQEQDLTTIYNSGNHLLNLINDILDQAKIEANELNLKFGYFDVKPMIESVKSIAIGMLKEKPLALDVEVAPNMPQAFGDEFRSRQILLNLVSNGIKFTNEGGLTIRAYAMEGVDGLMVRIDVIDTGIGVAEKDMPILFEQFRQVDNSLTRTVGGTGLGLPISKSLAEMQGGELLVASEVNVGSTFSVTIPCYEGAEQELERQREERKRTQQGGITDKKSEKAISSSGLISKEDVERAKKLGEEQSDTEIPSIDLSLGENTTDTQQMKTVQPKRSSKIDTNVTQNIPMMNKQRLVLLIEDNKDMVDQFRRILQREGFEVQTADFPAYAEAMVSQMRPQVVLLDVNFSGGKGWDLLKNLKERDDTFDIPIVVTTMSEESERAYRLGAHMFIQRPFLPDELLQSVLKAELESQHERILIIDDQPDTIRLLTQLLHDHGDFKVFSAQSGDEGISLVARRRPDLIILDLRMPGKDGFAVLDELRGNPETAKIPVLVVTGDIDLNSQEQEQLLNIKVLPKTDISQDDYDKFIENVRAYLEANNGTL